MPSDDPNEHVAMEFHGLVSDLQRGDVMRFEEEQRLEREKRAALLALQRANEVGDVGMTASELLKKIDGDPADEQRKIQDDLARIEREAKAAVAQKDTKNEPLPQGHFPPPPTSE